MPGPPASLIPTMPTMSEHSRYREQVANPLRLEAHPDNPLLRGRDSEVERTFFCNGMVAPYDSGRFLSESQVRHNLREEGPEPLTLLLTEDARW